ncbi:MAG: alpha/beta hydrolase [Cyanobacteria bacterium P01_A01_bin.3]
MTTNPPSSATPVSLEAIDLPPRSSATDAPAFAQMVLIHGWGANYRDLVPVAEALGRPSVHYWFPNAPFPHPQVPGGGSWFDLEGFEGVDDSSRLLEQWLLGLESKSGIPLEKTVLAGFSQGGAMSLRVGLGLMPRLAGIVCLSGFWVGEPADNSSDEPLPPVLMVHGRRDPVVAIAYAYQARRKLEEQNVNVQFHEIDAMHEIPAEAIALTSEFLDNLS